MFAEPVKKPKYQPLTSAEEFYKRMDKLRIKPEEIKLEKEIKE